MRNLLTAFAVTSGFALLSPSIAEAGGVGVTMGAGLHQDRAYYYRDDGAQGIDKQTPANSAVGAELLLGDRDDRIIGLVRGYVSHDASLKNPDPKALGEDMSYEYIYPDVEEKGGRNVGVASVGIQWTLWGDPGGFQLIANSLIGSGFWTTDNLEYALFEAGVGVTYTMNERFQLMGSLDATGRFRKRLDLGGDVWISGRYMFD